MSFEKENQRSLNDVLFEFTPLWFLISLDFLFIGWMGVATYRYSVEVIPMPFLSKVCFFVALFCYCKSAFLASRKKMTEEKEKAEARIAERKESSGT